MRFKRIWGYLVSPATMKPQKSLQKHRGCPPAAHPPARGDARGAPARPSPIPPPAKFRGFGEIGVCVHRGRGRVGGEGVGRHG